MLYFLYGQNIEARNNEKKSLCSGRTAVEFSLQTNNPLGFVEYIESHSIFGDLYVIILDGFSETEEGRSMLLSHGKSCADSKNIFIILEKKATKEYLKKIEKAGGVISFFESKEVFVKKETPIVFAIADAFSAKDKKASWVALLDAYDQGVSAEEISGTLFWAVKSMCLAKNTKNAIEADLNPYVFQKAKKNSEHFTQSQLRKFLKELVEMYHGAHDGIVDFKTALEVFVLRSY